MQQSQTQAQKKSVAWKLQLHLRSDDSHSIMERLARSTLWLLMGAMMKPPRPGALNLCLQVSSYLGRSKQHKGKGKGKGKHGDKSKTSDAS